VIGQCLPRHRHHELLKFLRTLDREFPSGLDLHLIVDNAAADRVTPKLVNGPSGQGPQAYRTCWTASPKRATAPAFAQVELIEVGD
jgi:hypothetical protein